MDKILVVDDEAGMTELIALMLDEEDFDVLMACDGLEALGIARAQHPQLVLTDVMMPGMGGVELCRRLHEDPETCDTLVVLMTATEHIEMGECSAAGLIRKPFDIGSLSEIVHRHLVAGRMPHHRLDLVPGEVDAAYATR